MTKGAALVIRVATTVVVLPFLLFLIWKPELEWGFCVFVAALAGVGLYEYYAIVRCRQISPETIGGILAGTLITLSGHYHQVMITALMLYGGCLMVSSLHIVRGQHSVAGLSTSVFGVFYVGWLPAHVVMLHGTPRIGPGLVTLLVAAVALSDAAAYGGGSWFGKHKMAPMVSPNKTWEGSVSGILAALAGMVVFYALSVRPGWDALPQWTLVRYLYTGAILSVVGQIGDLAESCLKRDAGVKDSGVIFPGHGGMLDRCDGYLFTAPVLYYMVTPLFNV
jgi:phosphatidate cytidylyltransferase